MPMRRLLVLCALLLPLAAAAQSDLTNQRLFDTGPYLPDHYARRVALFEAEPVETGGIVFLGDSITEAGPWARLLGDSSALNRGISGDVTFGVLGRLDDVVRRRPAKLFLLIGINDIGKDIPDAVIADNQRKIVEAVQAGSPETAIYIQSLLPLDPDFPGFPQHYDKEDHVVRTNRLLRGVAAETGVRYVNLYGVFMDHRERLDNRVTGDGLHLNEAGYVRWIERLRALGHL